MFEIVRFENPSLLYFLLLLPAMVGYYIYRLKRGGGATVRVSSLSGMVRAPKSFKYYLRHAPLVMRLLAVGLLVLAVARPQRVISGENVNTEGIDIVMSLDISGSMLARDFAPDRLEAAKSITAQFIMDRPSDRVGLVVFAGEAFTQSPLTTDRAALVNLLQGIRSGMITDGTAIGNGLATAVNRLKESDSPSKVIVLLTDGVNNSGQIDPMSAAQIAADYGIRVYTVGVGTQGVAPYPAYDAFGNLIFQNAKVEIDEKMLGEISKLTGGDYFRATDNDSLKEIYAQINKLEKAKVEVEQFTQYRYVYHALALMALVLLLGEFFVRYFVLRRLP